jgi:large subunit ribosomal protein L6
MKFVSKRHIIKIPSEISILYCENSRILLVKNKQRQKLINLKVKILILKEKNIIVVTDIPFVRQSNKFKKHFKSLQGAVGSLIKQSLLEVSIPTCKKLKLVGVGYKVFDPKTQTKDNSRLLHLKLGFSHSIYYKIPKDITINVNQSTKLFISGYNYNKVYQTASVLRSFKTPEPYKGKGILYANEVITLKEGKKV